MSIDLPVLDAYLEHLLASHVHAGATWLDTALSQPGQGIHHPFLPNPSSAVGDMPAEQLGHLKDSIGFEQSGPLTFILGSLESLDAEGAAEALELETRPPTMGGRPFLTMTLNDPDFHHALLTGVP
jgi:hypothetical protein